MKDYFREFLLNNQHPNLGQTADSKMPIRVHLIWALVTGSLVFLSWTGSKFYTKYSSLKEAVEKR